ncbi:hypothetical protein ABW20_dc0104175 [Dactylellina cionopaga]|nr:hypothetical protein ABW20_dc0104175 [Dactylellina cionopaga]
MHHGPRVLLVDTPDFDTTGHSDSEVLEDVLLWLETKYPEEKEHARIIYLHDINIKGVTGSSGRNLEASEQVCRGNYIDSVVLAKTDGRNIQKSHKYSNKRVDKPNAETSVWRAMVARGSGVVIRDGSSESVLQIVRDLVLKRIRITELKNPADLEELTELDKAKDELWGQLLEARMENHKLDTDKLYAESEALKVDLNLLEENMKFQDELISFQKLVIEKKENEIAFEVTKASERSKNQAAAFEQQRMEYTGYAEIKTREHEAFKESVQRRIRELEEKNKELQQQLEAERQASELRTQAEAAAMELVKERKQCTCQIPLLITIYSAISAYFHSVFSRHLNFEPQGHQPHERI